MAIWHEKQGMSADEIVREYPHLTLPDVHAALAYYWDHRDEIERRLAADEAFAEELRRRAPGPLEMKRRQRLAE